MDLAKVEWALEYALSCSLGQRLKPKFSKGIENTSDLQAIQILHELRAHLGIKIEGQPATSAVTSTIEDWSDSKKAPQY